MKIALGVREMLLQAIYFARHSDPGHRAPRRFYLAPLVFRSLVEEMTPAELAAFRFKPDEFCGVPITVSGGTPRMVTAEFELQEL